MFLRAAPGSSVTDYGSGSRSAPPRAPAWTRSTLDAMPAPPAKIGERASCGSRSCTPDTPRCPTTWRAASKLAPGRRSTSPSGSAAAAGQRLRFDAAPWASACVTAAWGEMVDAADPRARPSGANREHVCGDRGRSDHHARRTCDHGACTAAPGCSPAEPTRAASPPAATPGTGRRARFRADRGSIRSRG